MKDIHYKIILFCLISIFIFIQIARINHEPNESLQIIKSKTLIEPEMQITIKDSVIDTVYIYKIIEGE